MLTPLMRIFSTLFLAMLITVPLPLSGQTTGNWDAVRHFSADEAIRVSLADGRSFQGKFQSATDGELLLSTAKAQETLARTDVTKLATKGTNHRVRNAVIGLGAGAGLGVGAIVDHESACKQPNSCLLNFPNLGKAIFTPVGALAGLIVGALIPSDNSERQLARSLPGEVNYSSVSAAVGSGPPASSSTAHRAGTEQAHGNAGHKTADALDSARNFVRDIARPRHVFIGQHLGQVRQDFKNCQQPVLAHVDHAVASRSGT